MITIHNHPQNMTLPAAYAHLKIELPDIDTADITAHFGPSFNFIEEGRVKNQGALAAAYQTSTCLSAACSFTGRQETAAVLSAALPGPRLLRGQGCCSHSHSALCSKPHWCTAGPG